ncbi:MAG: 50S ribosomal protein L25 [Clostridia bacterium]|nr:50S ribosomal protein L25 [Clostridia bacterium]
MEKLKIDAKTRKTGVKSVLSKVRNEGYIPAVVYGKDIEPTGISVKRSDFRDIYSKHGKAAVIDLNIDDSQVHQTIIKEVQFDLLKNDYLHIDFQKISMDQMIESIVPIRLIGREAAEKSGGLVVYQTDEITIESLPTDMLESIEADISDLDIGDNFKVGDLTIPEGVTVLTDPEEVIAIVTEPEEEEVEETEEDVVDTEETEEDADATDDVENTDQ